MPVNHVLTATTPDDPAWEIRPSHWNSAHSINLVGSEVIGAFSNDPAYNVSFSTNGGGFVVASANVTAAPSPVNITGANGSSVNAQTLAFSNANGISLGVSTAANGATVTGSYTVPTQSVQTQASGNIAGTGFTSAGANVGISGTNNTAGLLLSITAAAQSQQPMAASANNGSFTANTLSFSNANGVSFATSAGSAIVGSVATTYRASNDAIGLNSAVSNVTATINSSGLSLDARGYAGTGFTGTNATATLNSNGLQLSVGAGAASSWTVSDNATSATVGRLVFTQANGITMSLSTSNNGNHTVFASHNGLTTAAASNHSHGNPTLALTNLTGTTASASNGLTLSLSGNAAQTVQPGIQSIAFANTTFTTGAVSFSNANGLSFGSSGGQVTGSYTVPTVTQYFSNTATTFNGANISGSLTLNTAGLNMSLSVAAPGAAAENNAINLLGANTAGNTTATGSTIGWSGLNATLSGTNGSQVVISVPATSSLSATGQVSISVNGSTISIGAPGQATMAGYIEPAIDREWVPAQIGNNQVFVQPMNLRAPVKFDEIIVPNVFIGTTGSSGSCTLTMQVGIYTRNASTLSLVTSNSGTYAATMSGTQGSYSLYAGVRDYPVAMTTTLTAGNYWIAFVSRTTTGGAAGMTWSNFVASQRNSVYSGRWSSANNATNQWFLGMGSYATTSTALPSSIGFNQINGSAAINARPVIYELVSQDLN